MPCFFKYNYLKRRPKIHAQYLEKIDAEIGHQMEMKLLEVKFMIVSRQICNPQYLSFKIFFICLGIIFTVRIWLSRSWLHWRGL